MDQKPSHISNRTPLLDQIEVPADLRRLPESDLRQVADELRASSSARRAACSSRFGKWRVTSPARWRNDMKDFDESTRDR